MYFKKIPSLESGCDKCNAYRGVTFERSHIRKDLEQKERFVNELFLNFLSYK